MHRLGIFKIIHAPEFRYIYIMYLHKLGISNVHNTKGRKR